MNEVISLSKDAAEKGGVYSTHLRDEGIEIMAAIEETIEISQKANIPVILTHHKVIGKPMWGKSSTTLDRVNKAKNKGVKIFIDQYPYNASHTGLSVLIPAWARAGGQKMFKKRLADPKLYERIKSDIIFNLLNDRGGKDLRRVQFARVKWNTELEGKTLHDWIIQEGKNPQLKTVQNMLLKGNLMEAPVVYIMQWTKKM